MEKESIHLLRKTYNNLIDAIQSVENKSEQQENILQSYKKVRTDIGRVCHVCGMDDVERKVIYEWYHDAIHKMTETFTK